MLGKRISESSAAIPRVITQTLTLTGEQAASYAWKYKEEGYQVDVSQIGYPHPVTATATYQFRMTHGGGQ